MKVGDLVKHTEFNIVGLIRALGIGQLTFPPEPTQNWEVLWNHNGKVTNVWGDKLEIISSASG